ncbi:uncharacterized protein DUF4376 [Anaerospora hongkongensis]|uniref:Uncharacterized protein DUF4376 n=1 Tax=Anaerospora hongkongensis TaxID=244830 RepID=A0A4R1Q3A8_9FIRM|nr:DUF4376 domain-containing protein [Anaerospora hongkongensis]TCL35659.1 uncharacterized protein DUF4376 [Anaerospora hongkongensis]
MYYAKFKNGERETSIVEDVHFLRVKNPIYNTEEIMTVIGTDPETGEDITQTAAPVSVVIGYDPDTFEPPIPEDFVQITDEEQALYCTGEYIRGEDGKPVKRPAYVPTVEELKERKWGEIKEKRDRLEQSGVPYLGKVLDSDTVSVQRIAIAVQAAQAAIAAEQPFTLEWTMQDNTAVEMDAVQVVGMSVALAHYSDSLHQTARGIREQIEAATTAEELANVKWPE